MLLRLTGAMSFLAVLIGMWANGAHAVTIDWVPVGNAGNANDPATGNLYGGVAYNYSIDKYDVTVGQYTDFLNAVAAIDTYGLYNPSMGTDQNIRGISRSGSGTIANPYSYSVIGSSANLPITYVSWGDSARFANWLQNGQPGLGMPGGVPEDIHSTEDGAYTLNGDTTVLHETRNANATIFIPSESEWYKAAYYDPRTTAQGGPPSDSHYWNYGTGTNTTPTSAMPGSTPNTANFYDSTTGFAVTHSTSYSSTQNYLTAVGAYTASTSPYGLYDMSGDVWQWNEALIFGSSRGLRGGSWDSDSNNLPASSPFFDDPASENLFVGFRVASVPEPSTAVLAAIGLASLIAWRRRRVA